jgi:apolipoprotein N-acyltransferase
LLWLAPVPVLAVAPRLRASGAFLLGSFAWLIGEMNQWNYVTHEIEMPLQIVILFFVIPAVAFGFGVLFMRSFFRRGSLFLGSLAFPVYWVAYEYLTEIGSPHSTWGNLAYTQMNCLPIIHVASITGLWGISFIVFLFAGTIAALFKRPRKTMGTSRVHYCCRRRHLRAVSFWRMAVAIDSFGSICRRDTHREGCADERLSRPGRASAETVA